MLMPEAEADDNAYDLEDRIGILTARLSRLRAREHAKAVPDYTFRDWAGNGVKLSELFGDRPDLIVIHNMGMGCRYCTMWADGINGLLPYLEKAAALVVISPDPPEKQKRFATERGWNFRMVSAEGTPFFTDMGFSDPNDDSPLPGTSTFGKQPDGKLLRHAKAYFGPHDRFCAVYSFLDLLPPSVEEKFEP